MKKLAVGHGEYTMIEEKALRLGVFVVAKSGKVAVGPVGLFCICRCLPPFFQGLLRGCEEERANSKGPCPRFFMLLLSLCAADLVRSFTSGERVLGDVRSWTSI